MIIYRITSLITALLFSYLFLSLFFDTESFVVGIGLPASETASVLGRRASVFMLGLSVLLISSINLKQSPARQHLCLSLGIVMLGLAGLGSYELIKGTINAGILPAIFIETALGTVFFAIFLTNINILQKMDPITLAPSIPMHSMLHQHVESFDYCDSISREIQSSDDIRMIVKNLFKIPGWAKILFLIRNILVKPFGLKTSKDKNLNTTKDMPFPELATYPNELIMHATDKHLKFWLSVLKTETSVIVTTALEYKMRLGKFYFFLIKPFHILIIKSMLSRL